MTSLNITTGKQLEEFAERNTISVDKLAKALNVTSRRIYQYWEYDGELPSSALAKIKLGALENLIQTRTVELDMEVEMSSRGVGTGYVGKLAVQNNIDAIRKILDYWTQVETSHDFKWLYLINARDGGIEICDSGMEKTDELKEGQNNKYGGADCIFDTLRMVDVETLLVTNNNSRMMFGKIDPKGDIIIAARIMSRNTNVKFFGNEQVFKNVISEIKDVLLKNT